MRVKILIIPMVYCLWLSEASATTLKEVVSTVLDTNPVIIEQLKNYRATREDIGIASVRLK